MEAAFRDPALDAQAVFRTLLDALAAPGVPRRLAGDLPAPPQPLGRGAFAAVLALVDYEAPLWLGTEVAQATEALRFHTGAPLVDEAERAAFAVALDGARLPALADFAQGSDAYPDRSTTLLMEVAALEAGGSWRLTGPGIRDEVSLEVRGLPFDFVGQWADNRERFPRGIDVFLFRDDAVVGLPRTTRIEED